MAKKLKAVMDDDSLANAVRTSAAQIWQAGLGAFAKAQEEGSRVFSKLVKDGAELQKGRQPARRLRADAGRRRRQAGAGVRRTRGARPGDHRRADARTTSMELKGQRREVDAAGRGAGRRAGDPPATRCTQGCKAGTGRQGSR